MTGKKFIFVEDTKPVLVPLWREAFTGIDWMRLQASAVNCGGGVPEGDGSAVITVPGFMGHDFYLKSMNRWLNRIGYKAYNSGIGHNAECPDILIDRLLLTIQKAHNETGHQVHLIGHSLGGVLSRAASNIEPNLICSVTTLGSPFRGIRSHPRVLRTSQSVKRRIAAREHTRPAHKPLRQACFTMECNCPFAEAARSAVPDDIYETAIYTRTDGVVDWNVCLTGDPAIDFEVSGTHCGLAWNPEVYRILGKRLDEAAMWRGRMGETRRMPRNARAGILLA